MNGKWEPNVIKSNSVVLLGDFNPAIFSPDWILRHLDFSVDDGEKPEIKFIHGEISDFMMSDIRFTTERNRFMITSASHDIELIASLALQMFNEVLVHTPMWAYGVNFEKHIDFVSHETRNKIGRELCPLEPWGSWASDFDNADPELNSGLSNISMKKIHSKKPEIYEVFSIQPSNISDMKGTGIFFKINNHFGDKNQSNKNDEKFRNTLFENLREKLIVYKNTFEEIVEHFMKKGGVSE
ncbi:MAG: hypothetical protein GY807_12205 [Gammaproteobacteria bacterium]|nr:hypothetical protein [Gammaproteobacteria bacterium]